MHSGSSDSLCECSICIATLSCLLAGCWGSPPPLPSSSSSCSPLFLLRTSTGTALPTLPVCACVPAQGCSLRCCHRCRSVSLRAAISRCGAGALLGTIHKCNRTVSRALLQLSNSCKWDSDLTMVPFLWTSFETTGGGKQGKIRIPVLFFWRHLLCTGAFSVFWSWLSLFFPRNCNFWNILIVFGGRCFILWRLNKRRKRNREK